MTTSTRALAENLSAEGHQVSHVTVGRLLRAMGYSMQANRKKTEGAAHPDRDGQFRFISDGAAAFIDTGDAVISVDTKKKEVLANYKAAGQRWEPKGTPTPVDTYDFPYPHLGRAIPYGIYDLTDNHGFVSVGISHDTAAFSAHSLRTWWRWEGAARYADATRVLITADCGGSNARSSRLWKVELAAFAAAIDRPVHVRHFPPGTSKWNKVEHRLFAPISVGMRARPPVDLATVVGVIGATTTSTGLDVTVHLDEADYPKGTKISDKQIRELPLTREDWHPEWNYTLHPR